MAGHIKELCVLECSKIHTKSENNIKILVYCRVKCVFNYIEDPGNCTINNAAYQHRG